MTEWAIEVSCFQKIGSDEEKEAWEIVEEIKSEIEYLVGPSGPKNISEMGKTLIATDKKIENIQSIIDEIDELDKKFPPKKTADSDVKKSEP